MIAAAYVSEDARQLSQLLLERLMLQLVLVMKLLLFLLLLLLQLLLLLLAVQLKRRKDVRWRWSGRRLRGREQGRRHGGPQLVGARSVHAGRDAAKATAAVEQSRWRRQPVVPVDGIRIVVVAVVAGCWDRPLDTSSSPG